MLERFASTEVVRWVSGARAGCLSLIVRTMKRLVKFTVPLNKRVTTDKPALGHTASCESLIAKIQA